MSFRVEQSAARAPPVSDEPEATATPSAERARFGEVFASLASRVDTGEKLVSRAVNGSYAGLEPAQWVALQAGIYRYVEAVDLAGKLVDRAGTAIRTVLQAGH